MPAASELLRSDFCAFFFFFCFFKGSDSGDFLSLSIVSMPEVLLHIASPELNGTVL